MKKGILVATDASPASNRAIALAADLAAKYDVPLTLLHVVRDMQLPASIRKLAEVEKLAGPRVDVMEFVAEKILDEAEARAKRNGATKITRAMGHGDPASVIQAQARKRGSDLVVMGTRGLGKVKGVLLGSVSRKLTNLCEVNCLVVH